MARRTSSGTCERCQRTLGKGAMTRHLAQCVPAHDTSAQGADATPLAGQRELLLHLVIQGKYSPEYWLHLEVPASTTLARLDHFLRDIWLECCGHLSQFIIQGAHFAENPDDESFGDRSMNVAIGKVLRPGMEFLHEYDFGSTTTLSGKLVSVREGVCSKDEPIKVLARNIPPLFTCVQCGKPATQLSRECGMYSEDGYCDRCAEKCGTEEDYLPVVNSPRCGTCGYTG